MKFSKNIPVKIIVLGCGGTGGYIIPHLYRISFAAKRSVRVIVCDGDIVERKNLIRQNFIEQDIGRNKAQVLSERYASAFGIEAEYIPGYIESEDELFRLIGSDTTYPQTAILIGALDNNKSRRMCHQVFLKSQNLVFLTVWVTGAFFIPASAVRHFTVFF